MKPNLSGNTLIMKGSLQAEPFAQDIDFILAQLTQVKLGRTAHAGHCLLACILPLGIVLTNRSPSIAPPKSPYNERLLASAAPRAQQPERGRALKRAALGASPPPGSLKPITKGCVIKMVDVFSLKLQRNKQKNASAVDPAKGKTGKKALLFTALWR